MHRTKEDIYRRAKAARLYAAGITTREIAAILNMSKGSVSRAVAESGVALRGGRQFDEKTRAEIITQYKQGVSVAEIMKSTGVRSTRTVYDILREQGISVQRRSKR